MELENAADVDRSDEMARLLSYLITSSMFLGTSQNSAPKMTHFVNL